MNTLSHTIVHYGYAGLFFAMFIGILAIPIPIETLLVVAGVLAGRGKINVFFAGLSALAGAITGISISYWIGLTVGASLLMRYGRYIRITPAYLSKAEAWFRDTGEWILLFGYFVTGLRHLAGLLAGMSRLDYRRFSFFAYPGAALWTGLFLGLGYALGDRWESAIGFIHRYTYLAIIVGAFIAGLAYLVKRRLRKRTAQF